MHEMVPPKLVCIAAIAAAAALVAWLIDRTLKDLDDYNGTPWPTKGLVRVKSTWDTGTIIATAGPDRIVQLDNGLTWIGRGDGLETL
jgi:hypothetical protein